MNVILSPKHPRPAAHQTTFGLSWILKPWVTEHMRTQKKKSYSTFSSCVLTPEAVFVYVSILLVSNVPEMLTFVIILTHQAKHFFIGSKLALPERWL